MSPVGRVLDRAAAVKARLDDLWLRRRWERLLAQGMHIGNGVNLTSRPTDRTAANAERCSLRHQHDLAHRRSPDVRSMNPASDNPADMLSRGRAYRSQFGRRLNHPPDTRNAPSYPAA